MTLIGTLVGLLLSVLGVVAMLALYRAMVDVSTSSGQSAVRDSQLASALLGAQMELQGVGWRIEPGEAGDNLRLAGDGRGVVWRFRNVEGGPLLCAGLRIVADAPAAGAAVAAGPDGPPARMGLSIVDLMIREMQMQWSIESGEGGTVITIWPPASKPS